MDRPLRIAYFDLGFSKEEYGLQPTKYGGGAVAARYLKEDPEIEFHIFAPREAFDNVGANERLDRLHPLPDDLVLAPMRAFAPLPFSFTVNWGWEPDIILHPHTCHTINTGPKGHRSRPPVVHFCGFDGKAGHPYNDYILLYDPSFTPQFGERPKYVRIGKPVPEECPVRHPYDRYAPSFVFQCSRHDDHMNSIALAKACRAAGIRVMFAGPIHNGYPLMDHIDGDQAIYLGEISEQDKLALCRRARLFSIPYAWDPPFSQSIIEAQGQGCPIYCPKRGPFLSTYLQHGVNGFDANLIDLESAFRQAETLDRAASWRAARAYDTSVMVATFKQAFREIAAEWYGPR